MSVEKSTATMEKNYLRVSEVARDLDVSPELVYLWIRQGRLRGTRFGKQTLRIHGDDYGQFLQDVDEGLLW
jgi:excisionase family DNA binding protein